MYLLYTFETKLLTITYIDCESHYKLFMYFSHKSVHAINYINYTLVLSILKIAYKMLFYVSFSSSLCTLEEQSFYLKVFDL